MKPGIICCHISTGAPVLRAVRDEPQDENDSGWALACGQDDHITKDYLIVDLDRHASKDETLVEILELPVNTLAVRAGKDQPWIIEDPDYIA